MDIVFAIGMINVDTMVVGIGAIIYQNIFGDKRGDV